MTSLSAEAIIIILLLYREGLISVIKNRGNQSSCIIKDRKMKWEDVIVLNKQKAGITSVFVREDNIVCLPTAGYGKSIEIVG